MRDRSARQRWRLATAVLIAVLAAATNVGAAAEDLPPWIPEPERLPLEIRAEISAIWKRRTIARTAAGQPAPVPIALYQLFVDAPEITAAAGLHLGVGKYRVTRQGADVYDVEDGDGARGQYRVIARNPIQRVVIAKIERTTRLIGHVRASSLSLLTLTPDIGTDGKPQIAQRVDNVVRIDHRVVALIAKLVLPLFPEYADRKIAEIFNVAAKVSAWGHEQPEAFCQWLAEQPDADRHRQTFGRELPACARTAD